LIGALGSLAASLLFAPDLRGALARADRFAFGWALRFALGFVFVFFLTRFIVRHPASATARR
jgi:hypothetical protein